jgi:hypothetical protein
MTSIATGSLVQLKINEQYFTQNENDITLKNLSKKNINKKNFLNYSSEYYTYESNQLNPILIDRKPDKVVFEYLELKLNDPNNYNLDDIKNIVLNMEINGEIIQQFPLSLLINLNEPKIYDGKMYVNLCFDIFFGDVKLISLQQAPLDFKLDHLININNLSNNISSFGIVSTLTYLDNPERKYICYNGLEEFIQQVSYINIMVDLDDENKKSDIFDLKSISFNNYSQDKKKSFEKFSKGFFIECNNIDNLNNLQIELDNKQRLNFNHILLFSKCKKISNNILYVPFNYNKNYFDRTLESLEGSSLLIYDLNIKLQFDTPINNVKIYNLHSNIYRQSCGFGGLASNEKFFIGTYDLVNNKFNSNK